MEENDFLDYESGPFCRHFSDVDCPETCANCGHRCTEHTYDDDDSECREPDCSCDQWVEVMEEVE